MPHVIVKMFSGRTEDDKKKLAERVTLAVMNTLGASENSISVAIEDVSPSDWSSKVFDPDITDNAGNLYKKPGYERF